MKNKFTKTFCTLLCLGFLTAHSQTQFLLATGTETERIPLVESGVIKGQLLTTDQKAATEVIVTIKIIEDELKKGL